MGRFVLARAGQAIVVLIGITIAATLLIHAAPGDPAQTILGGKATPDALAQLRAELGLDKSLPAQYLDFVGGAVTLQFGDSLIQRESVTSLIRPDLGATLLLTVYATLIAVVVGVPLGVLSAVRKNRLADHSVRTLTMMTFAMPPFWLGLLLILVFGVRVPILPTTGYGESFAQHVQTSRCRRSRSGSARAAARALAALEPRRDAALGVRRGGAARGLSSGACSARRLRNSLSRRSRCSASTSGS